ncbi:hypothetical protein EDD11_009979, partial [Mortierella claussenii]
MDHTGVQRDTPHHHHHHHHPTQQPRDRNDYDMALDHHPSGSSPSSSFARISDHNNVINHGDMMEVNFAARFSEFVRSARQDASSENPVIETYIDNEDYQSLLYAVSNVQMSHSRSLSEAEPMRHLDSEAEHGDQHLTHSPNAIQEDHVHQDNQVEASSSSSSAIEDIYDLQHIMIHNQRQHEDQMRQSRATYFSHEDGDDMHPLYTGDYRDSYAATTSGMSRSTMEEQPRPLLQEPYQSSFDPRPTISSSYFSPTTESTIVLSSPPPGRSSNMFSFYTDDSMHLSMAPPDFSSRNTDQDANASPSRHGNGPYRPFITGSAVSLEWQHRQDLEELEHPAHQSSPNLSATTNSIREIPSNISDSDFEEDASITAEGDNGGGHWSAYASLAQQGRSFEQHRYHYFRRLQQQRMSRHRRGSARENTTGGTRSFMRSATHLGPRPAMLLPQASRAPARGGPQAASNQGSSIPIPTRYVNPQPFNYSQYTSSATVPSSASPLRPHNIMTSYNHHGDFHRPNAISGDEPSAISWRRTSSMYSETVERAEAGGWAPPSLSSNGRNPSIWYNSSADGRTRNNISRTEVMRMACRFCETIICERGMKAQLLADQSVALLSTDDAPQS